VTQSGHNNSGRNIVGLLSLAAANLIISQALSKARELSLDPMTVVVLDAGGALKAMAREDGSGMLRYDLAFAKAWGAVGMGWPSSEVQRRAELKPTFIGQLTTVSEGRLVASLGGVLIINNGQVIGGVGVTGDTGENDQLVAEWGISRAGLTPDSEPEPRVRPSAL
jgi:uncharacterized protein GlcG (DUF336 family)